MQAVHYDTTNVYVSSSGIPYYYDTTNNNGNHNAAHEQDHVWKFPRFPQPNTGALQTTLGGGQYGLFIDGTTLFNAEDAQSYNQANVWYRIAYFFEGVDFDSTLGHSTPTYTYHHHVIDLAFVDTTQHNVHSPLIGYMFDGYPVYGPYGYRDSMDANSPVVRMASSYAFRNITTRQTLADGTVLQPSQYGPATTDPQYPLGCFRDDYTFVAGSGNLDAHNGRFCKTPEYPNGTYAYFCTLDSLSKPRYPFTVGQTLYGTLTPGNQGPNGGNNTIPSNATLYVADTSTHTGIDETNTASWSMYPNPTTNTLNINISGSSEYTLQVTDLTGRVLIAKNVTLSGAEGGLQQIDFSDMAKGTYLITLADKATGKSSVNKVMKI